SRRRHTRFSRDWSSDVCSSDLPETRPTPQKEPLVQENTAKAEPAPVEQEPGNTPLPEEQTRLNLMIEVIDHLRVTEPELSAYFEQTVPLVADKTLLKLGIEPGHIFENQILTNTAQAKLLETLVHVWGSEARLEIVRNCASAHPHATAAQERVRRRAEQHRLNVMAVKTHPKVVEACRIFGAQVKSVQVPELST